MMYEPFSKRLKKQEAAQKDVYTYDEIPEKLRVQVSHIWDSAIGDANSTAWDSINLTMSKILGVRNLTDVEYYNSRQHCYEFLQSCSDGEALDIIECSFVTLIEQYPGYTSAHIKFSGIDQDVEDAIKELNYWFKDNSVGYEFVERQIIRIDQTHLHQEVIKPAITLLFEEEFEGAAEEFLNAHGYYRKGEYKNALAEALKAFESTMKTICDKKGFTYNKGSDTAQRLINVLFENNLIPEYLRNHFSGLRNTLEAGLPTVRNKQAGHGQGSDSIKVEPYFVEYAINLAATNIVFLIKAYKESK